LLLYIFQLLFYSIFNVHKLFSTNINYLFSFFQYFVIYNLSNLIFFYFYLYFIFTIIIIFLNIIIESQFNLTLICIYIQLHFTFFHHNLIINHISFIIPYFLFYHNFSVIFSLFNQFIISTRLFQVIFTILFEIETKIININIKIYYFFNLSKFS